MGGDRLRFHYVGIVKIFDGKFSIERRESLFRSSGRDPCRAMRILRHVMSPAVPAKADAMTSVLPYPSLRRELWQLVFGRPSQIFGFLKPIHQALRLKL